LKKAFITGVTGQDGSYLAELLLEKGYEVHGLIRRTSEPTIGRISHLLRDHAKNGIFRLHFGDLTDTNSLVCLVGEVRPDEVYNLGAQSDVAISFEIPEYTANVDALGPLRLLEAIRSCGLADSCRYYQASTSELFGSVLEVPQTEATEFRPQSPYAIAKQYGYWITKNYRETHGMYACNGILFNHESPRRGVNFVTRKITKTLARIACGLEECLILGNLNSLRDWGHARDYVEMQWLMLQQDVPNDFVIATGHQISVREFAERAAQRLGILLDWSGTGVSEIGTIKSIESSEASDFLSVGQTIIRVSDMYFRPAEMDNLVGSSGLAREKLGWIPSCSVDEMIAEMVDHDLAESKNELIS